MNDATSNPMGYGPIWALNPPLHPALRYNLFRGVGVAVSKSENTDKRAVSRSRERWKTFSFFVFCLWISRKLEELVRIHSPGTSNQPIFNRVRRTIPLKHRHMLPIFHKNEIARNHLPVVYIPDFSPVFHACFFQTRTLLLGNENPSKHRSSGVLLSLMRRNEEP